MTAADLVGAERRVLVGEVMWKLRWNSRCEGSRCWEVMAMEFADGRRALTW